jgi:hypothetical protein
VIVNRDLWVACAVSYAAIVSYDGLSYPFALAVLDRRVLLIAINVANRRARRTMLPFSRSKRKFPLSELGL